MHTGFDVAIHGFAFPNRFIGSHVVGELAAQGRLDAIVGIDVPGALEWALARVRDSDFWGRFGLCGGMSWAALDNFRAGRPTTSPVIPPGPGTELFESLVHRQADSFRGRTLIERLALWQVMPDSTAWWRFWIDAVGKLVQTREWPSLRIALEAGRPQSICLVRSRGTESMSLNHQVVAIGYEVIQDRVSIDIYDPNHPRQEPRISFAARSAWHRLDAEQSTGEPVRGFFVWPPSPIDR